MKHYIIACAFVISLPCLAFSACPTLTCPDDRDTPVAEYLFENNLLDTSGHGLDGIDNNPGIPVTFAYNVGGRPGYCVNNLNINTYTGILIPACVIYSSQGEIEWYQYVTNSSNPLSNFFLEWCDSLVNGAIGIYPGDGGYLGPTFFRVDYRYWNGSGSSAEEFAGEWLQFNQWQHCSFQWGPFGSRIVIDGVMVAGSYNQWYQGLQDSTYLAIGTWPEPGVGFSGYIDDLRFWPCSSHGTFTVTATMTYTQSPTITPTGTVTETWTISPTCTNSPVPTGTYTITPSPTISPTVTISPTPSGIKLIGAFPNPAGPLARILFTADSPCKAEITLYNISGENVNSSSAPAVTGINAVEIQTRNYKNFRLASGAYIYKLELDFIDGRKRVLWNKLFVLQ